MRQSYSYLSHSGVEIDAPLIFAINYLLETVLSVRKLLTDEVNARLS